MTEPLLEKKLQEKVSLSDVLLHNSEQRTPSSQIVLVIENHDDTRSLLKAFLETKGYRVAEATDGEQVLELFGDNLLNLVLPDLVLTETVLPGLDGLAVINKLRMFGEFANVPIVFLSSRTEQSIQAQAFALGGNDFLTKPIELKSLEQTLGKYLDRNQTTPGNCSNVSLNVDGGLC